ncbi:Protein GLUTAMINE DUMPER like [Quillaja saponaria]|uniref:Protein GLUTAMINE DUMPER like n=1 Tax=Quillaja saponaria TaxID=32244 RepID=A0AAD7Q3K8_QUISA|nr:Protein GLUTAMINE DUMPER like [Quillaja saponaria]
MKPSSDASSATRNGPWKSPIPYLFGSLAIMITLILVALIILVCSYRKRASSSSSASEGDQEKPTMPMNTVFDTEPKIVVIMAGDDKPTYLAKPITSSSTCCCEQV